MRNTMVQMIKLRLVQSLVWAQILNFSLSIFEMEKLTLEKIIILYCLADMVQTTSTTLLNFPNN